MIKTFTIATTGVDSDNERIFPGAIKMPNKPVHIFHNFDHSKRVGLVTSLTEKDGNFIATAEIDKEYLDSYPAIGYSSIQSHIEGDVLVLDEVKLWCVSLCSNPNVDPSIKTIGEQTNF